MKILFCASEVVPFAKTGGLADVAGALPLALEKEAQEVVLVMPAYKSLKSLTQPKIQKYKEGILRCTIGKAVKVYFIENDAYYNRDTLYGDKKGDYPDNLDRFSYYCRKTLELAKEIGFKPDIVHCHDWQSALIPVFLKTVYLKDEFFKNTKTVFTIHNIGYQGLFPKEEYPKLGLDWKYFTMDTLEFYDKINILKGGLVFSDIITTVSPTYSREIQTKEFGFGLEGILSKRRQSLFGILNGLDYSIWNPETDTFLEKDYSLGSIEDKGKNKAALQRLCGLPVKKDVPLFGIVSRLAQQKGFDILADAMEALMQLELQCVILGTGDLKYHEILEAVVKKYPKKISLYLKFDDCLAHKIYAGSDIFLMPSKYEPCGLGQLISLRYGTIPLAFKTGGLADTVTKENGFVFEKYSKDALIKIIKKSIVSFQNNAQWNRLRARAMKSDFSWGESARRYVDLYKNGTISD
ncbi:MAG: glycogen synthase GlgA [Candidatus Omnitrophota bacterium]|jgi:starch synthase|nr:MAG: glycogen synthase GlgA [Candidatus Omnitrophota bacterium]